MVNVYLVHHIFLVAVEEVLTKQEIQVEMVETEAEAEVETDKTLLQQELQEQLIPEELAEVGDYLLVVEFLVVVES
jgi:hypothetical protein